MKLRTNVVFSMRLDLTPFLSSSVQNTSYSSYRLYAVVVSKYTHKKSMAMNRYSEVISSLQCNCGFPNDAELSN